MEHYQFPESDSTPTLDVGLPPHEEIITATSADGTSGSERKRKMNKRTQGAMRKAPYAPKRFKSSYICFFMAKQDEIKEALGDEATVALVSKKSAEMWKNLPAEERAHWDQVAAKDKERYDAEKASYTGPWQVPWKRAKKDPSAPKRPMSAFLQFSQGRRTRLKEENPTMKNTEISRVLGNMWRECSEEEKRPYVEKEKKEREQYKIAMAAWKKEFEVKQEAERKAQQEKFMGHNRNPPPINNFMDPGYGSYPPGGHMYAQQYYYPNYGYPQTPFPFPTDGTQPVILGPNGLPVDPNFAGTHSFKEDEKVDHSSELHDTAGFAYGDGA